MLSRGRGVEVLFYHVHPRDLTLSLFDCLQLSRGGFLEFHGQARFYLCLSQSLATLYSFSARQIIKVLVKDLKRKREREWGRERDCSVPPLGSLPLLIVFSVQINRETRPSPVSPQARDEKCSHLIFVCIFLSIKFTYPMLHSSEVQNSVQASFQNNLRK